MAFSNKIANKVAVLLGITTVEFLALEANTDTARFVRTLFQHTLETLLREGRPNFAKDRQTLAQSATAPNHEFSYKYRLPIDCLHLEEVYNELTKPIVYRREGNYLLTNSDSLKITYIKAITDMSLLDPLFENAFVYKLAADLALPLTGDDAMSQTYERRFQRAWMTCKAMDAQENSIRTISDGPWVSAHLSGVY